MKVKFKRLILLICISFRMVVAYYKNRKRRAFLISSIEKADYRWRTLPRASLYDSERHRLEVAIDTMQRELDLLDGRIE